MRTLRFPRELDADVVAFAVLMAPLLGLLGAVVAVALAGTTPALVAGTPAGALAAAVYAHRRGATRGAIEDVALRAQALTLALTALLLVV